jgi:cell division protein FtsQ
MKAPPGKTTRPRPASWEDLVRDPLPHRVMAPAGRKRRAFSTLRTVGCIAILCTAAWAGFELYRMWESNPARIKAPAQGEPLKTIAFQTNGVLDRAWAGRTLAIPPGTGMMALDLFLLRDRLLATGQVRAAVLARNFPDTLSVVIEERDPVARIVAREPGGAPETFLVDRIGTVYSGINYPDALVSSLPYLADVRLRRVENGNGFAPVEGMETVSNLIGTARAYIPALFSRWHSISLARLAPDGVLVVRSADVETLIFGTRDDFFKQVAQLDFIVDESRAQSGIGPIKIVDLSVGRTVSGTQIPVTYGAAPLVPGQARRSPAPARAGEGYVFQP